jgi:putative polyhydroxyalkanoate system protein
MSTISLRRTHKLSHSEAVHAADSVAAQLKDEYGIRARWEGDTMHFERIGASGTLRLAPKEMQLDVHLGFLLTGLRNAIAREIERHLDEQLAPKPLRTKRRRK